MMLSDGVLEPAVAMLYEPLIRGYLVWIIPFLLAFRTDGTLVKRNEFVE
jgi:hypothetical protein